MLLQNNEKLTTKALANELVVTERTIHRDMEALSRTGIPVFASVEKMEAGLYWKAIGQI
ncbi:HTH domain-containing protein [Virgibacillus sp. JSM 102003]|uniref:HTH domain-containing protein n=1 Tax=Virgibacillus sp. JSM 102003 TaxID=1562108 RepID=UPI0035C0B192